MRYFEELYPNGNCKCWKRWRSDGTPDQEFAAFTDGDNNGIRTSYDENGNMIWRESYGNPDGSQDIHETWDEEGTYSIFVVSGDRFVEGRCTYADGGYAVITYDYEAGTVHTIRQRPNDSYDMISDIYSNEPIEGYIEGIGEDGMPFRTEYVDGYKYMQFVDGGTNYAGYTYRETTYYYPSGAIKSEERYFYADGGRVYAEFDENGDITTFEDTTMCDD